MPRCLFCKIESKENVESPTNAELKITLNGFNVSGDLCHYHTDKFVHLLITRAGDLARIGKEELQ